MRIGLILVLILLSATAFSSAEGYCHEDNCFTNRGYINLDGEHLHVYYNSLFTIGENWFVVFHVTGTNTDYDIDLSLKMVLPKACLYPEIVPITQIPSVSQALHLYLKSLILICI